MKAVSTQGLVAKNLLPYMGIQFDRQLTFNVGSSGKPRHFRVFTYQAYNAMGLIGPEMNGIAICDDDKKQVICDGICKQQTGYFGASQAQFDEAERICGLQWEAFRDFVNGCRNLRMRIGEKPQPGMTVQQYIAMSKGQTITGYEGDSKERWLKAGVNVARRLAKAMGLAKGTFDIRVNKAGPAVSGDVHLHGEWIYVALEQSSLGGHAGFMWRLCRGRKDYTGLANQWASWDELLDVETLAKRMLDCRRGLAA